MANKRSTVKKKSGLQDLREPVNKPQTLKKTISKHLDLRIKWYNKQFKTIIDSGVTRNHIIPQIAEQLGILYREKEHLYPLITILGEPVLYRDGIINLKTGPIQVNIKGQSITVNFNILPLGTDKAVLKII